MSQSEYAFQFIGTDTTCADQILMDTLIYTFRSAKSGHQYQVNIERYADHLCGVKFFDRTSDTRIGKFLLNRLAVADMDAYMQKILDFVV